MTFKSAIAAVGVFALIAATPAMAAGMHHRHHHHRHHHHHHHHHNNVMDAKGHGDGDRHSTSGGTGDRHGTNKIDKH